MQQSCKRLCVPHSAAPDRSITVVESLSTICAQKPLLSRTRGRSTNNSNYAHVYLRVHASGNGYTSKSDLSSKRSDPTVIGIPFAGKRSRENWWELVSRRLIIEIRSPGCTGAGHGVTRGFREPKRERVAVRAPRVRLYALRCCWPTDEERAGRRCASRAIRGRLRDRPRISFGGGPRTRTPRRLGVETC